MPTVLYRSIHLDILDLLPELAVNIYDDLPSAIESMFDYIDSYKWFPNDHNNYEYDEDKLIKHITKKYEEGKNVGVYLAVDSSFHLCRFIQNNEYFKMYDAHCTSCDEDILSDFSRDSLNICDYIKDKKTVGFLKKSTAE
jgi:hypothetical protein